MTDLQQEHVNRKSAPTQEQQRTLSIGQQANFRHTDLITPGPSFIPGSGTTPNIMSPGSAQERQLTIMQPMKENPVQATTLPFKDLQGLSTEATVLQIQEEAINRGANPILNNLVAGSAVTTTQSAVTTTQSTVQDQNVQLSLPIIRQKRATPSSEIPSQPQAKKPMAFQAVQKEVQNTNSIGQLLGQEQGDSITQYAMRAPPPYFTNLKEQPNAENSVFGRTQHATQGEAGILGTGPPLAQNVASGSRRRPSGWDITSCTLQKNSPQAQQGTTRYKPGAATWKRYGNTSKSVAGYNVRKQTAIPPSPCRSDANSGTENTFNSEHSPLHTPTATSYLGTQDSRLGGFSPPQMASEYYIAPLSIPATNVGTTQTNLETGIEPGQGQTTAELDNSNSEAMALALKAPQAP